MCVCLLIISVRVQHSVTNLGVVNAAPFNQPKGWVNGRLSGRRCQTLFWQTIGIGLGLVKLLQSSFVGTKSVVIASVGIESVGTGCCTLYQRRPILWSSSETFDHQFTLLQMPNLEILLMLNSLSYSLTLCINTVINSECRNSTTWIQ